MSHLVSFFKKYHEGITAVIAGLAFLYFCAKLLSPGAYVDAEEYELSVNESTLISLINDFKEENPQYKVRVEEGLKDGRRNVKYQDHWFHIYFYYPQENKIIKAWTRAADKQKTTLVLVAIGHVGSWKFINKDFGFFENRKQKKIFEERILNKIKEKIKR